MMKKSKILLSCLISIVLASTTLGMADIEFTTDESRAGCWSYDGAGTFTFVQDIVVDRALGVDTDPLVDAFVHIPVMTVGWIQGGLYTLSGGPISISDGRTPNTGTIYLTGTLSSGDLVPVGTIGAAYTVFKVDITGVTVTVAGLALGSDVLDLIAASGSSLDFELSMNGGLNPPVYTSFVEMLDSGYRGEGPLSGAMTIPEPATLCLLGLGTLALLRKRSA